MLNDTTGRSPVAPPMPYKARIEINRLVHALARCTDQAKCVEIEARSKSLRTSTYLTDRRGGVGHAG